MQLKKAIKDKLIDLAIGDSELMDDNEIK